MRNILLFLLLVSGHLLLAQTNGKYQIRAAHLFDSETGRFVEALNDQLIDLSQQTVLPGLIDAHTHLLYKEIIYPQNEFDGLDPERTITMDGDAYRACQPAIELGWLDRRHFACAFCHEGRGGRGQIERFSVGLPEIGNFGRTKLISG